MQIVPVEPSLPIFARGLRTFRFICERVWRDGAVTQEQFAVEAYGLDVAKMLFAYRVGLPVDVLTQNVVDVIVDDEHLHAA